jgi:hypothetical protein
MPSKSLDDLTPEFKPLAEKLIDLCREAGIEVCVVTTLRSLDEEKQKVALKFSSTLKSKHLPQEPSGKSDAIDLAPYVKGTKNIDWNAGPGWKKTDDPGKPGTPLDRKHVSEPWATVAELGESLGLRCGARWRVPFDPGHFERVK